MKHHTSIGQKVLIAVLFLILIAAVVLGLYAWAKYAQTINPESTTAQVAKWNFDLTDTEGTSLATTGTIDLASTLAFNHVASQRVAPGTNGSFQMIVDTTGTEVSLVYTVDVALTNCPVNLNFYTSDTYTEGNKISKTGNNLHFEEYVSKANAINFQKTITVYWNWPYETLDANNSSVAGDAQDKLDSGKTITMQITAKGTEVLADPTAQSGGQEDTGGDPSAPNSVQSLALAGTLQVGDSVNYNPGSGSTASLNLPTGASILGAKMAAISLPAGASLENTISASEASDWIVLDVDDQTGEVLIIPRTYSGTKLTLDGKEGYNNAIEALDMVAGIYLNPAVAKSARSIRIEDVNKVEGHTPNGNVAEYTWNHKYGVDSNLDIIYAGEGNAPSRTYASDANTGYYKYSIAFFSGSDYFWLASRCFDVGSNACAFYVRRVANGYVTGVSMFSALSNGYGFPGIVGTPVLPVVSLKSGIQLRRNTVVVSSHEEDYFNGMATESVTVVDEEVHLWEIITD